MTRAQGAKSQSYRGLAGALLLLVVACKSEDDPEVVADRFVDAYYLEFDLGRAQAYADGAAAERLTQELALVDAARARTQIQAAKARVYYEAPERHRVGDDMLHSTYPLEIRDGQHLLTRQAVVMVSRREGVWKVIQFREHTPGQPDPPPPGAPETRTASTAVGGTP